MEKETRNDNRVLKNVAHLVSQLGCVPRESRVFDQVFRRKVALRPTLDLLLKTRFSD